MPKSATKKAAFTVLMDPEVKGKIERIAAINNQSLSQHLEELARVEIESVSPETWRQMERLTAHIRAVRAESIRHLKK